MDEIILVKRAKVLRTNSTEAENAIWYHLRANRMVVKIKRQVSLGPYIVDFLCLERRLIIEIDGGQHQDQQVYDEKRTAYLNSLGYRVLRFWNNEVLQELPAVMTVIQQALNRDPAAV